MQRSHRSRCEECERDCVVHVVFAFESVCVLGGYVCVGTCVRVSVRVCVCVLCWRVCGVRGVCVRFVCVRCVCVVAFTPHPRTQTLTHDKLRTFALGSQRKTKYQRKKEAEAKKAKVR